MTLARRLVLAGLVAAALAASLAGPAAAQDKPRLGVLGVETSRVGGYTDYMRNFADYVRNLITHDVTTLGRFDVVERSNIDAVLREQKFQLSGAIDPDTAVAVGRILGIDVGLIASLEALETRWMESFYRAEAVTMVRLIDMQTGRLLATLRVEGSGTGETAQEAQRRALDNGSANAFATGSPRCSASEAPSWRCRVKG
ncbi:MAG: CsgG/HfaB family protein [Limnochordales bacterium]